MLLRLGRLHTRYLLLTKVTGRLQQGVGARQQELLVR